MSNEKLFSQKQADQLARMFNVGFNSAMLYGGDHPTTIKNIAPFIATLSKYLETIPVISIIIDRGSLFIEEFNTDEAVNPKRIIAHLLKSGIESITFENGVHQNDIFLFFKMAGDIKTVISVQQIQVTLKQSNCKCIRLNHVHYGKITSDETLVSKDRLSTTEFSQACEATENLNKTAIDEIERVITLAKLIEEPQGTSTALTNTINGTNTAITAETIARMRAEIPNAEHASIESLLNAVLELKVDLSEALAAQKLTGKILSAADPVQKQMDNLTCDVLVKLVKEEYHKGEITIHRLAQIIRRMLPDLSELKRILPMLKTALLADGMSLTDYLQLIKLIDLEVESESLATMLDDAASGIGVSAEDIVNAIKAEPKEAAKLMFLAAEIRQGTEQDDAQLSSMLTEYIEKVSSSVALDSKDLSGPQGSNALNKILTSIEEQLVEKLHVYGIDEPVLLKVKDQLKERFSVTFDNTVVKWMLNNISPENVNDPLSIASKLNSFLGKEQFPTQLKDPLVDALVSKGFGKDQIESFINQLSNQISNGRKILLPSSALSPNNMIFLLNREIKQHLRYNTPFSTLFISVKEVRFSNGNSRKPTSADHSEFVPILFNIIRPLLRDIDLIGSLGGSDEHIVFTLLTMTNENGAKVVQRRLLTKIISQEFRSSNLIIKIIPAISITVPVKGETNDLHAYLEKARKEHTKECLI